MKKQFLLCVFLLALVQWSNAQTVKLYSNTGVLKNTYTTVAAAIVAAADGDSLLMSPHVFNEHDLLVPPTKTLVIQGSVAGFDTSTIDAQGISYCFNLMNGTIRDVILTNGNGGCISGLWGHLGGCTIIRNTRGRFGVICQPCLIDGNVKIENNILNGTVLISAPLIITNFPSPISRIEGNVQIKGNKGGYAAAILIGPSSIEASDTIFLKSKSMLSISGNVVIENNEGINSGAILSSAEGAYILIDGASIINNKVTNSAFGAAISVDTNYSSGSSKPYDSIGVPLIRLHNVRIYNPLPSGARQTEISMHNRRYTATRYKPGYFYSDACWWGNSDTTGLFKLDTGTYCSMPTWAVTQWSATPFGTALSNVRSQMKINTGAALPSSSLSGLQANFWATAGSFSVPRATINASNYLASDYYFPTSGSYKVYAAIDADTFKPSTKALGIPYLPNNQFVFTISPNPSTGTFVISDALLRGGGTTTKQSQPTVIKVYDLLGRIVYEQNLILNKAQTPLALNLAKGTYILELRTEDAVQRERIVIAE
jgi:hypothetical protein